MSKWETNFHIHSLTPSRNMALSCSRRSAAALITNHLLLQVLFTENLLVSRDSCSSAIKVSFITALCVICRLVNLVWRSVSHYALLGRSPLANGTSAQNTLELCGKQLTFQDHIAGGGHRESMWEFLSRVTNSGMADNSVVKAVFFLPVAW